ncbi:MAG: histidine phosphatase family protein [Lachnospiraceae bacterium]|nr:histidine phosphatase family protein [Lachnospiraceae bacterium]
MRIIFIRHGDPDYVNDSLTDKGVREAKLLSDRIVKWNTDNMKFYCSPLGRAQKTASYTLQRLGREAITYDWLKEFSYFIDDPVTGRHGVPWDFMPEYWTQIPQMYDREDWKKTEIYRSNPDLLPAYEEVCTGLDRLIDEYGYKREQNYYKNTNNNATNDTVVIFCHLGITCVMMSHLLGISPALLFHDFYLAPTSMTILATEERQNHAAYFRVQVMGDTTHLLQGKEPISAAGYFTDVFQG